MEFSLSLAAIRVRVSGIVRASTLVPFTRAESQIFLRASNVFSIGTPMPISLVAKLAFVRSNKQGKIGRVMYFVPPRMMTQSYTRGGVTMNKVRAASTSNTELAAYIVV